MLAREGEPIRALSFSLTLCGLVALLTGLDAKRITVRPYGHDHIVIGNSVFAEGIKVRYSASDVKYVGSSKQKLPFLILNSVWNDGIYYHVGVWPQSNRVR